jgi:Holliday junction resolvasome RuvABC DNA-binding subunit
VTALIGLGYTSGEAMAAVRNAASEPGLPEDERLRRALAYFRR